MREMEEIGKALKSAFAKVNQARPEDIDRAGLELLNSGILTVDDLGALLDRYEDNPTMRRLIAQHVEKLLKDTKDTQTRSQYAKSRWPTTLWTHGRTWRTRPGFVLDRPTERGNPDMYFLSPASGRS